MEWLERLMSGPSGESKGEGTEPPPGVLGGLTEALKTHGLGDLVTRLRSGGLGEAVSSWVGRGENQPVTGDQIRAALGPDMIEKFAARLGLPPGQASAWLSQHLPQVVDKLTPNGTVDEGSAAAVEEVGVDEAVVALDPGPA
jgi:uncharacterized protein YidB (DUF937 family)